MSHIGLPEHQVPPLDIASNGAFGATAPPAELPPGTVWLVGTDPSAPALDAVLASPALRTADAVLCDAGLSPALFACIRGLARYVEVVPASADGRDRARRRCVALAGEGWRLVRIFRSEPVGAADVIVTAATLAEAGVALRLDGVGASIVGSAEMEVRVRAPTALPLATASFAGTAG